MHDTRFKNGLAFGPYANFFANTANVFSQADATPDVSMGNLFFSNNTSNTTITHFDLQAPPGDTSPTYHQVYEGKAIRVIFLDDSTRLVNGGRLVLTGSEGLQGANNSIELLYHNSSWIEFNRSYNNNNVQEITSASLNLNYAVGTGQVTIRGRGPSNVLYLASEVTGPIVLRQVVGGEPGSQLTLIASWVSDALVIVNSASNIDGLFTSVTSGSSTQFRLASSASVIFTKFGNRWIESRPVFINSSAVGVA